MKYCSKCGAQLVDDAVVCPKCGCNVVEPAPAPKQATPVSQDVKYCSHCGNKVAKEAVVCPACGCAFNDRPYPGYNRPVSHYPANPKMTAAMVLGIISVSLGAISFFSIIGFLAIGGFVCGIIALVFQHKYKDGSGKNKAALACGVVGLVLCAIAIVIWILYLAGVIYYK